jgi:hypothetical protein
MQMLRADVVASRHLSDRGARRMGRRTIRAFSPRSRRRRLSTEVTTSTSRVTLVSSHIFCSICTALPDTTGQSSLRKSGPPTWGKALAYFSPTIRNRDESGVLRLRPL